MPAASRCQFRLVFAPSFSRNPPLLKAEELAWFIKTSDKLTACLINIYPAHFSPHCKNSEFWAIFLRHCVLSAEVDDSEFLSALVWKLRIVVGHLGTHFQQQQFLSNCKKSEFRFELKLSESFSSSIFWIWCKPWIASCFRFEDTHFVNNKTSKNFN